MSLTKPTNFANFYDVADPDKMKINAPEILLDPAKCFSITDYIFHIKDQPANKPDFINVAADKLSFDVFTNSRVELGYH